MEQGVGLTPRETAVVSLVSAGKTNAEIALDLQIRPGTVKKYLETIRLKTATRTRVELALWWQDLLRR